MLYPPKKNWSSWPLVVLLWITNIFIIASAKGAFRLNCLLIISAASFLLVLYYTLQTHHSFRHFTRRFKSFNYKSTFQCSSHSINPNKIAAVDMQVLIGNKQSSKPYHTNFLSINTWRTTGSSLLPNTILNGKKTEGAIWQIDSSFKDCRNENGGFNSCAFKKIADTPDVKIIEIKLTVAGEQSYRIPPKLAVAKSKQSIISCSLFKDSGYTSFRDAEGLVHFIYSLRELSGGKPVGIRLHLNNKNEFYQFCHAIRKTDIIPDFIVIESLSQRPYIDNAGSLVSPEVLLYQDLLFASTTLKYYGLKQQIKLIAAGKITSGFEILKLQTLGADCIYSELPFSDLLSCAGNSENNSTCCEKIIADFYNVLIKDMIQSMKYCGFSKISDVTLAKFLYALDGFPSKEARQYHISQRFSVLPEKSFLTPKRQFN